MNQTSCYLSISDEIRSCLRSKGIHSFLPIAELHRYKSTPIQSKAQPIDLLYISKLTATIELMMYEVLIRDEPTQLLSDKPLVNLLLPPDSSGKCPVTCKKLTPPGSCLLNLVNHASFGPDSRELAADNFKM